LVSGLKDSVKMAAAGTNFMDVVKWYLHLSVEALTDGSAEAGLEIVCQICLKRSREIANIMPRSMEARGFSVHVQLTKFYRYQDTLAPETRRLGQDLKTTLDPDRRFNRSNLGL